MFDIKLTPNVVNILVLSPAMCVIIIHVLTPKHMLNILWVYLWVLHIYPENLSLYLGNLNIYVDPNNVNVMNSETFNNFVIVVLMDPHPPTQKCKANV